MQRHNSRVSVTVGTVLPRRRAALLGVFTPAVMLAGVFLANAAFGQEVHWNAPGALGAGQHGTLELVFEETQPAGSVRLPKIDGLQIVGAPSQATSLSVINGKQSASVTLSYHVRPEHDGEIDIPAFEVQTSDGTQTVAGVTLRIEEPLRAGTAKAAGGNAKDAVQAQLVPSDRTPYAGEVFDVDFVVASRAAGRAQLVGTPEWETSGLITQPWGEGKQVPVNGGAGVRFHTRAVAPQPGTMHLGPARQEVQIGTGRRLIDEVLANDFFADRLSDSFFDSFFGRGQTSAVTAQSPAVPLDVQPLPQPAPPGFSGAVGEFQVESKLVPTDVRAGEPVTWMLTLRGTGNWPDGVELPARAIPSAFRTLQPKQQKDFAANDLFHGTVTEDLVMIPNQPGTYHLEPVSFVYFDPKKGQYDTAVVEAPPLTVTGTAVAAATTNAQAPGTAARSDRPPADAVGAPATVPLPAAGAAAQARLPHDALPGAAMGAMPWSAQRLAGLAALPFLTLVAYWLCLSLRRARLTDPQRVKRQAFAQIGAAIDAVRCAPDATQRAQALFAWQRASAIVLDLDLAAPTLIQVRQREAGGGLDGWADLWSESERTLYSPDAQLPAVWCDHAKAVRARTRRPRFNPLRLCLPRNLVPATTAACVLLWAAGSPAADTAAAEYAKGNFAAAQQHLQVEAAAHPNNWVARYNLGLVAAQLGAPGRALGETTAAFLQQPRHASVRWNLLTFAAQVPGANDLLVAVASGTGMAALARAAAPAWWQAIMLAGAGLFCSGGALLLRQCYMDGARPRQRWTVGMPALAGFTLGLAAVIALREYGPLADPTAALVAEETVLRSVPTDAQDAQVRRPIPAGSIVVVHNDFLGWINVALANGETGWLRREAVVPLYGTPTV